MIERLFCLAMVMLMVAGCRQREDLTRLKAINQSFENTNNIIQDDNKLVWEALQEKRLDPQYSTEGKIWEPRASRIKAKADSIVVFIQELKSQLIKQSDNLRKQQIGLPEQLYSANGPGYKLVSRLAEFKNSFPAIVGIDDFVDKPVWLNTEIAHLYSTIPLLTGYADSLNTDQRRQYEKNWLKENFSGISPAMALIVLSRLENDLLITTNKFMNYCLDKTAVLICSGPGSFSSLATLNSSYVKQGETIEVTAGVVGFKNAMRPRITINGKDVRLNEDAAAVHSFTANGKPGSHSIRVQIEFHKPDGTLERVYKNLKYIIADNK